MNNILAIAWTLTKAGLIVTGAALVFLTLAFVLLLLGDHINEP